MVVGTQAELEATNRVLRSIGEAPIDTTVTLTNIDAINALAIVQKESRVLQTQGWSFNVYTDVKLAPDKRTSKIPYLPTYLYLKCSDYRLAKRGDYIYNVDDQTFIFDKSITVDITRETPFEDLPYVAQDYIVAKASVSFAIRYLGDADLTKVLTSEIQEAYRNLNSYELDQGDFSIFDNDDISTVGTRS